MKLLRCLIIVAAGLLLSSCATYNEFLNATPVVADTYQEESAATADDPDYLQIEALPEDLEDYEVTDIDENDTYAETPTFAFPEEDDEYSDEPYTESPDEPSDEYIPIVTLPAFVPDEQQEPDAPAQQTPPEQEPPEEANVPYYQDTTEEPPEEEENEQTVVFVGITVRAGGVTHTISFDEVLALSPQAFSAYPRDVQRNFTGVPIATILRHLGIDHTQSNSISVFSYDGFGTGISMAEAMDTQQAFIAIAEDGVRFYGRGGEWNRAPFMLVMAQDPFANRFARYVTEIVLQ